MKVVALSKQKQHSAFYSTSKQMTWLSCAQYSQTFPEDGYTKPRPARQWVLKNVHCHSSGSFNPNPRRTAQRGASMARPQHESGHSSAVRHLSCTGIDLREPSVDNIWRPLRLFSLRAVPFLLFPPFDCKHALSHLLNVRI